MNNLAEIHLSPMEMVSEVLALYARRGVFRAFSEGASQRGKISFSIVWHHGRRFDVVLDMEKNVLRFHNVLSAVPANSAMYGELKDFVKSRQSHDVPEHRSINKRKAEVRPYNRRGNVSLSIEIKDADYVYATRKIVHLVNEIFLVFLIDGAYYEYLIETLGVDPA